MSYAEAIAELYQAPLSTFVAERKRLAGNLKAEGDKPGAAKLVKLGRPTTSAWVINQLWWHARHEVEAMFATAERLRTGELAATAAHRESLAKLRARAATILTDAGHGATEATLRRVMTTIAALAATGGFEPDLPGTLAEDRDPPGFDAIGLVIPGATSEPEHARHLRSVPAEQTAKPEHAAKPKSEHAAKPVHAEPTAKPKLVPDEPELDEALAAEAAEAETDIAEEEDADVAEQRRTTAELAREALRASEAARLKRVEEAERRQVEVAAAAARRRADEERARLLADRNRLEAALRTAQGEIISRGRAVEKLRTQLAEAEKTVADSRAAVADLESKLMSLPDLDE